MKVFYTSGPDSVLLQMRAEGDGILGDSFVEMKEGDVFFGIPYEELEGKSGVISLPQPNEKKDISHG